MSAEKLPVHDFYRGDQWSAEESIGYLLRTTVSTLMRAAETAMRPHGLTSVQWAPLMIISRGGNPTGGEPGARSQYGYWRHDPHARQA